MDVQADAADVIVVGAGPAGSTTAYHLARSGVDVLLLEKASFPRDKVCGDGLTPRAVRQLVRMGVDTSGPGWIRNEGLRIVGGGMRLHLPWPELASYPDYGLVRTRTDFDQLLAQHAAAAGARLLQRTSVTSPVIDERSGRVVGVRAKRRDELGRSGDDVVFRAPLVVAADGASSRLATSLGIRKRDDRPMGVAVRTYFKSPRHDDHWMESWLELWAANDHGGRDLLPGYGWIFGAGNGTSNVGLGITNTSKAFGRVDYKDLLRRWIAQTPHEWGFTAENQVGDVRGAALPMGFNRQPHYQKGLLLVGDSGGMINPFNGEGIDYAMEAACLAAGIIADALSQGTAHGRERVLQGYPVALKKEHGGYFTLGRIFLRLIGDPRIMQIATKHGLPRPWLMKFTLKLLANLTDHRGGDVYDRVINAMTRLAPAA